MEAWKHGLGATAATLHIWEINPDVSLIFMMDVNGGSSRLVSFVFSMQLKALVFSGSTSTLTEGLRDGAPQ